MPKAEKKAIRIGESNTCKTIAMLPLPPSRTVPPIPDRIPTDMKDNLLAQFYTSFLESNSFTGKSGVITNIHPLLHASATLSNAAMAVSVLHLRGHGPEDAPIKALNYYRTSISLLQLELNNFRVRTNMSVLWSTFFLGMFELMYDSSGDGWIKHFLFGTSRILQFLGPSCLEGIRREFFITIRVFEVSRALIFTEETFLNEPQWQNAMAAMWGSEVDWHPKESLLDLMISCSSLGVTGMRLIQEIRDVGGDLPRKDLEALAIQGLLLQKLLHDWWVEAHLWQEINDGAEDGQMTLAIIFYRAITIYLSGLFDYFSYWDDLGIPTPAMTKLQIQQNVTEILSMTSSALKRGKFAGILFMFPLRVAGARAKTMEDQRTIVGMLSEISKKGFVVAGTFIEGLNSVWNER